MENWGLYFPQHCSLNIAYIIRQSLDDAINNMSNCQGISTHQERGEGIQLLYGLVKGKMLAVTKNRLHLMVDVSLSPCHPHGWMQWLVWYQAEDHKLSIRSWKGGRLIDTSNFEARGKFKFFLICEKTTLCWARNRLFLLPVEGLTD